MRWLQFLALVQQFVVAEPYNISAADVLAEIPACSRNCVVDSFTAADCNLANVAFCVCTNVTLQLELSKCTQMDCVYADQVKAAFVEQQLCAAYPAVTRGQLVVKVAAVISAIVLPTVAIRLYARIRFTNKLWIDDYATILGAVLLVTVVILSLYSVQLGLGMHYWAIPLGHGATILRLFYISSILHNILQVVIKISIVLVFARLFPCRRFQLAAKGINAFLIIHGLVYSILFAVQCLPVYSLWDRGVTDRACINIRVVAYSSSALNVVEDIAILLLPVPQVWQLKIEIRRRLALLALFSIGFFACVTTMIRMKFVVQYSLTYDATWDNVDIVIWSLIEEFSSMICGTLPTLRLFVVNVVPTFGTWRKRGTKIALRANLNSPSNIEGAGGVRGKHILSSQLDHLVPSGVPIAEAGGQHLVPKSTNQGQIIVTKGYSVVTGEARKTDNLRIAENYDPSQSWLAD